MYNMLIVDDNPRDRNGIQRIIDWKQMGINIMGACANGKQAMEQIEELKPHIVLTDIAMPVMNGIEMAKQLKQNHPDIKLIFMSCYDDFDFARSAIDLDVYGYVLKPIIAEELEKAVVKVLGRYELEYTRDRDREIMLRQIAESLPIVQEQFLRELLFGIYNSNEEIRNRMDFLQMNVADSATIATLAIEINDYDNLIRDMDVTAQYLLVYSLKKAIYTLQNIPRRYVVQISDRMFAVLLFDNNSSGFLDAAVAIHEILVETPGINVTIGISDVSNNLSDIPRLYRQSVEALRTKFYWKGSPIIPFEEIDEKQYNRDEKTIDLGDLYKEVEALISYGDSDDIHEFIYKYFGDENSTKPEELVKGLTFSVVNIMQMILSQKGQSFSNILGSETAIWEKLIRFETIVDIRQWIYNIFMAVKEYLGAGNDQRNAKIAEDIKAIIKNSYSKALTVADIAQGVYLSPARANNIFKGQTGKTIFDYLIEHRMEKAKGLLKDPYSRIYLVAQQVGYVNKSHFSLLFKKYTGLTPSEYKERALL